MSENIGSFNIKDAGYNVGVNVRITKRNKKTGKILETREGHNRCLKLTLMSISKFLNGEFNDTSYLTIYDWVPRYLAVGTNTADATTINSGVTTEVNINDTRLLNELSPRMALPERNTIVNRSTQDYVQLIITTYLPEGNYVGESIAEAGLFSKESGNNCLFRITFDPVKKETDTVVEINWTISIISVDSENQPYEDTDKDDLRETMNNILDKIGELYPSVATACSHLKSPGIYDYGRSDVTQDELDADVETLGKDLAEISSLDPDKSIELTDEINGEVI